jgi:hypothetical protein
MRAERDGARTEIRATAQVIPTTCDHTSARLRAEALAFNLAAVNAGRFPPSAKVLTAIERLAWATAWDLTVVAL